MKTCADYIFVFVTLNSKEGNPEIKGVSVDEDLVAQFLSNENNNAPRVEVFQEGQLDGAVRTIYSIEEFEELQ